MDKHVSQVLEEAADLLAKPGGWTQGEFARDVNGTPLPDGFDVFAVCFCAVGAIEHVVGLSGNSWRVRYFLTDFLDDDRGIIGFNDDRHRTQAEVVDAFRRAAALAKEQGR